MLALVDLHRAAVGVLHDDTAAPRHFLMLCQHWRTQGGKSVGGHIERLHIETREAASAGSARRSLARVLGGIDGEVDFSNVGREVHGAFAVILVLQVKAECAIERRRCLRVDRVQHQGGYVSHNLDSAQRRASNRDDLAVCRMVCDSWPVNVRAEVVADLLTRTTDGLAEHLAARYDVEVTGLTELDLGVFRVDRADGDPWVARVFPAIRPRSEVEGDADILGRLERAGFPAERCAHAEPVSELAGQGVLVTGFVPGAKASGGRAFAYLGGLLGRLHAREGLALRPGGAWHHLVTQGGPAEEIQAALMLLNSVGSQPELSEAVSELDDCADLPHAFVHPDFVPANAIENANGGVTVVDWTGAGRGPRLWSLGFLLFVAGARSPKLVDIVMSRYRRHTQLTEDELSRLPDAIRARPLLIDCWSVATGRKPAEKVVSGLGALTGLSERIAEQARGAFAVAQEP
jgi:Ser/Thr protein kinase RdoA (MazF antagonist)